MTSSTLPDAPPGRKRFSSKIRVGQRNAAILAGAENLEEWDEEELIRGQRRSRRGTWEGRPPNIVPSAVHKELTRRKMQKAQELLRDNLVGATEALIAIVNGQDTDDAVRLKAATIIMDRVLGKTPERVDVTVQKSPFEASLDSVFTRRGPVIDVEASDG